MWLLTFSFLLTPAAAQHHSAKTLKGEACEPHSQPRQAALLERGRFTCSVSLTLQAGCCLLPTATPVRPVALPTRCPQPGEACVVSGWGLVADDKPGTKGSTRSQVSLPDMLHCANISVIPATSCSKDYPGRLMNTRVCAGVEGGGTDSCEGDSGGPHTGWLVCGGVLQGIVSWGDVPCDTTHKPGVYTKVCSYLGWIRVTMKRN